MEQNQDYHKGRGRVNTWQNQGYHKVRTRFVTRQNQVSQGRTRVVHKEAHVVSVIAAGLQVDGGYLLKGILTWF